jgi:hypothetical protein
MKNRQSGMMRVSARGYIWFLIVLGLHAIVCAPILLAGSLPLDAAMISLDHQNFPFIYLNVAVDRYGEGISTLVKSNFHVTENEFSQTGTEYFDVTPPDEGGDVRRADIVFVLDVTASMGGEIEAVRTNMLSFMDALNTSDINYRVGFVVFGDVVYVYNDGNLYTEQAEILSIINNVTLGEHGIGSGHDSPENQFEAMAQATSMNYRSGTQRVQILLTDAPAHEADDVTDWTRDTVSDLLVGAGMTVFPVFDTAQSTAREQYIPIAEATNPKGIYFNIYDNFNTIIDEIAAIVASTYVVQYKSSNPLFDGTDRHVVVTVSYLSDQATCDGTYIPGSAPKIGRITVHDTSVPPWAAGTPLTVEAEITDEVAPYVDSATLYYRKKDDANYTPTPMTHSSDIWSGTIPGSAVDTPWVAYYISATDKETTATDPPTDPGEHPHQIAILPNVAPEIVHTPRTDVPVDSPITITAQISDTTNSLASARLFYRKVGKLDYHCNGEMTNTSGDNYRDTIPSDFVTAAGVEYYILAVDDLETESSFGTRDDPQQVWISTNKPPTAEIETHVIDSANGTANFTWSGSDDSTPPAELVYEHRLLNPDSPLYGWSDWNSSTTAKYPRAPDTRLPDGTYRFQVKAKDADGAIQPDSATYEFTIGAGDRGSISGKVVDALTGQEISGATILLRPDPFTWCYTTDSGGRFSFPILVGTYDITAASEGYESESKTNVTISAGGSVDLYFSLQSTSIDWVTTNRDEVFIYEDALGILNISVKKKQLPAGWVLCRITQDGSPIEESPDGIRWFHKVQDVTDGTTGWVERGDLDERGDSLRVKILLLKDKPSDGFTFKEDLWQGMSNAREDIRLLQAVLNEEGSALEIDGYFGSITKEAVKKFQERYSQEILVPSGLSQGTGYVGSSTRAKLNQLLEEDASFKARYELEKGRAQVIREEVEQHKTEFELSNFPTDLILAMAGQETGYIDFTNEIVACTPCGRGIMQIDRPDSNVGAGSGITCYNGNNEADYCGRGGRGICEKCCEHGGNCTTDCKCYYTNTIQGIEANIKDALLVLKEAYNCERVVGHYQSCKNGDPDWTKCLNDYGISCEEMHWISAVQVYNQGSGKTYRHPNTSSDYLAEWDSEGGLVNGIAYHLEHLKTFNYDNNYALSEDIETLCKHREDIYIFSPVNVSIHDSKGRVTGLIKDKVKEEIPHSFYDQSDNIIVIYLPSHEYRYQVVGTETGTYGLEVNSLEEDKGVIFTATAIPTSDGQVHQYTIDWDALARGEEGVTLQVDNDGDGVFEKTIHAGSSLDGTTAPIANQLPKVSIVAPAEGEIITSQAYQIRWGATDPDHSATSLTMDLFYSTNGGTTWLSISSNEANDGVYQWNISGLQGGEYWLKIVAEDPDGATAEATTGPFTISAFEGHIIGAPNPVTNAGTAFFYALPEGTSTAKLMILNVAGRPVFETDLEVDSQRFPATGTWNPVDQEGMPLANGPYVYVLIGDGKVIGRGKMVIQR